MTEPAIAFRVHAHEPPRLEVRVNFGVFAGREATAAEIEELARRLAAEVDAFSVIAENRHEFGDSVEATLHQVRIEVERDAIRGDADALCDQLVAIAGAWATACIEDRRVEIPEL